MRLADGRLDRAAPGAPPPAATHQRRLEARIVNARQASRDGPRRIGAILGVPASTVAKVLARHGSSRLPRPPRPQFVRYERAGPGELLHVDTKRLGRFHQVGKAILHDGVQRSPRAGWHHLHVAVDDHSRIAYCEVLAGQGATDSCALRGRAVAWFADHHGIRIERLLTDNGHAYRSHPWRDLCLALLWSSHLAATFEDRAAFQHHGCNRTPR